MSVWMCVCVCVCVCVCGRARARGWKWNVLAFPQMNLACIMGDRVVVHPVVCCSWARVQVSVASIARGRFPLRGMYCTCLETSQVSRWERSSMPRWGCCPFQAPCYFRFSCSLEVTPLGWTDGCAQFLVSLDSWRVLAPGTECYPTIFSSCSGHIPMLFVLTDSWTEPWRLCKVFPTDLRQLPRVARSNSARILCLIALVSLDHANLNFSSNSEKVSIPLARWDSLLALWHFARSCAILSLHQ